MLTSQSLFNIMSGAEKEQMLHLLQQWDIERKERQRARSHGTQVAEYTNQIRMKEPELTPEEKNVLVEGVKGSQLLAFTRHVAFRLKNEKYNNSGLIASQLVQRYRKFLQTEAEIE